MTRGPHPSGHVRVGLALAMAFGFACAGTARAQELPLAPAALVVEEPLPPDEQAEPPADGVASTDVAPDAAVPPEPVEPSVFAQIDLSDQKMFVYVNGELTNTFAVSTARRGYITPVGDYQPEWLDRYHRSKKYHNSPMPWSVFFHGGYAIHGTNEVRALGRPASHGCIRLHPDNAKIFFKLVQEVGKDNVRIAVVN